MKKNTLVAGCLLLFVLGSSLAMADEVKPESARAPRLGVEGGINISSFYGSNPTQKYTCSSGLAGGAFMNVPLGSLLAIQPEILYEQKGGKINGVDYRLDYLEVPILLDVTLIGPWGILLGPSFNAKLETPSGITGNCRDLGMVLGTQLLISNFLLSGRYEVGLNDVSEDTKFQNGTFTFMAGLSFI